MKKRYLLTFWIVFIMFLVGKSQTPLTDPHWMLNSAFSDGFDSVRRNIWGDFIYPNAKWGQEVFRPANIQHGSENGRHFLRLVAEAENGTYYSGGMWTGREVNRWGLGYGYYEIEARLWIAPGIQAGVWPAFWLQHSYKTSTPPYWSEEIDIFEPNHCQVMDGLHKVGYWHRQDLNNFLEDPIKVERELTGVDMQAWHKYAVEWLPGLLIFYLDDQPFGWIRSSEGDSTPHHQNTNLFLDLQVDQPDWCPPHISNGLLGYFDINYFRYYQLQCSGEVITEAQGDGYDFGQHTPTVKESCVFKNTGISSGESVTVRMTDFVELKGDFEVPLGAEFGVFPSGCATP